ncbi:hypothetical protein [Streptomyces sp. NPDC088554]|uniref:hypothetical protein n=1 Tax=Streptomyces sp. NPDC088554 TaxID=3365865 RepID=UPI0038286AEF
MNHLTEYRQRHMTPPVHLMEPAVHKAPEPAPGCDVCGALAKQWKQATDATSPAYDLSHALDLAIEIGRHPHKKGRRS